MDIPHLLAHPDELNQETLYDLRRIVGVHPTYHAARILYLQNLFLLHDTTFDQELRRAALLVPDRRVLCNITQYGGLQPILDRALQPTDQAAQEPSAAETTNEATAKEAAPSSTAKEATVKEATAKEATAKEAVPPSTATELTNATVPEASASGPSAPTSGSSSPAPSPRRPRKKYVSEDTTLTLLDNFLDNTPTPLQRRPIKADPATDYMAYLSQADDSDNDNVEFTRTQTASSLLDDDNGLRMEQLIDGFITSYQNGIKLSENPDVPEDILIDPDEAPLTDYAEASASSSSPEAPTPAPEAGLTETLANIYIKQQKYDRALEVMTKMQASASNANPYLADQVRFLQKLAINNRHKR